MNMRKSLVLLLIGIMFVSLVVPTDMQGESAEMDKDVKSSNTIYVGGAAHDTTKYQRLYTSHAPIYINGNDDFASQALAEGWAGNGTEENPYIIENYDINASSADGIYIENTYVYFIIRNCVIYDGWTGDWETSYNGVYFYNVTNNKIDNIVSYDNGHGIKMFSSSDNVIVNCTVYNNYCKGIWLSGSPNTSIINCRSYNNRWGVYFEPSWNDSIINCEIYNNNQDGISLWFSSNNQISNCQIYNNSWRGIRLYQGADSNIINDCQIYNNSWEGILFYDSSNNTISTSQIHDNEDYAGVNFGSSSGNKVRYCNIYKNTKYGVCTDYDYVVNATYCWWGSVDGPYHPDTNPNGTGDNVSDNVLYDPWLIEPYLLSVNIIQPENGLITNQSVTLIYTIPSPLTSVGEHVPVTVDGPGNMTVYTDEGTYNVTVTVTDEMGNAVADTVSFTIDKTPPNITVTGVADNIYYNVSVTPVIEFNDANLNITTIILNSIPFESGTTITDEDDYVFVAYASDKAGNTAQRIISFTIDKTKPVLEILSPENNTITNQNIILTYSVSDNMDNPTDIAVDIENGTVYSDEKSYTIIVNATDRAGNAASKTVLFTIDKTPPTISAVSPAAGAKTTKSSIVVSGKTEPNAIVKINGVDVSVSSDCSFTREITLIKGENTITITAIDQAGNTNTQTVIVTKTEKKAEKAFIPGFEVVYLIMLIGVVVVLMHRYA